MVFKVFFGIIPSNIYIPTRIQDILSVLLATLKVVQYFVSTFFISMAISNIFFGILKDLYVIGYLLQEICDP